jgi:hypothetical protein
MKSLFKRLLFVTLIAATLTIGVSNSFASEPTSNDIDRSTFWHLDGEDKTRFMDIETGNGSQ